MQGTRILAGMAAGALLAATAVAAMRLHHFAEAQLDHRPYPLRAIEVEPPAARNGIEYYGKLRLEVRVAADGTVDGVDVLEGTTLPAAFQEAASGAFRAAQWEPGRKWGLAVGARKLVEVNFAPPSRAIEGSVSSPGR
jgi:outer membrane biosynthesis protein TonB